MQQKFLIWNEGKDGYLLTLQFDMHRLRGDCGLDLYLHRQSLSLCCIQQYHCDIILQNVYSQHFQRDILESNWFSWTSVLGCGGHHIVLCDYRNSRTKSDEGFFHCRNSPLLLHYFGDYTTCLIILRMHLTIIHSHYIYIYIYIYVTQS